jgi:Transglycosylase-like domain
VADFLSTLQQFESGGRNIPNTTQGTSSGQAQGYNQITTGTWKEFGGLAYAPTPLQATQDQQNAIAAKIPLKRWAPETLNYLRNNGFTLNPNATLADNIAANHGTLGTAPTPHSTTPTQAPGPIDPSIIARGGTSPPIPTTPGTTINSNPIASLGGKIGDLAGSLQKDLGKSDDDKAQPKPEIKPDIPPAPGARNISPLLGSPQIYAQRMAALNQPMTWGGAPPGQNPWTGYGVPTQPSVYGTSLMSNLQMLNDPTWMDQMAGGGSYG